MKQTALYCRISTDKATQKTDSQKHSLSEWVKVQGIRSNRLRWYEDKASGATVKRSALSSMLADVESGLIDTVVVYRLDRLSRSCRQGLQLLADLTDKGVRVVSVAQQIDMTGPMGKFLSTLFLSLAELERETIVSRIKDGLEAAKAKGKRLGRPRNDAKIRQIQAMRRKFMSVADIAQTLGCSRQNVYLALGRSSA